MEVRALVRELAMRVDSVELAGSMSFAEEIATSGLTRLPIRYRLVDV